MNQWVSRQPTHSLQSHLNGVKGSVIEQSRRRKSKEVEGDRTEERALIDDLQQRAIDD
jgi:hypothetical protein